MQATKLLRIIPIVSTLLLGSVVPVFAQTAKVNLQQRIETRQETKIENKQVRQQNRCENIQTRVDERADTFTKLQDKRANIYGNSKDRIASLLDKFEAKGCDVSQARTDLTSFQNLIQEYSRLFNAFVDSLHAVGNVTCDENNLQTVRDAVTSAQSKHREAHAKRAEVRAFYQNTLKPHLRSAAQTCKATLKSPQPSTETEAN